MFAENRETKQFPLGHIYYGECDAKKVEEFIEHTFTPLSDEPTLTEQARMCSSVPCRRRG